MHFSHRTLAAFSAVLTSLHTGPDGDKARIATFMPALQDLFPDCEVRLIPLTHPAPEPRVSRVSHPNGRLIFAIGDARQEVIMRRRQPFTAAERHLAARIQEHVASVRRRTGRLAAPRCPPSISRRIHLPELTPRECEVLRWIMVGKRNAEISRLVGAAPRTVGKHVENILRKLGVENRGAAARVGVERFARLGQDAAGSADVSRASGAGRDETP